MTNNTKVQDQPVRGTAGTTRINVPASNVPAVKTPATTPAPASRRQAPAQGGRTTRLGAGAPVAGNATRRGGSTAPQQTGRLKADTPMTREVFGGQWYLNESRFPNALSGAEIFETRENLALGITAVNVFRTADLMESRGLRAFEDDYFTIVFHFGPAVNFEFYIRKSTNENAKSAWYCNNTTLVTYKNGTQVWKYANNRKKDDAILIDDEKKGLRAADYREINNDKIEKWEIAVKGYTKDAVYGLNMEQEVIAQMMRLAQYAWEYDNGLAE
jgi:hypothetical protein